MNERRDVRDLEARLAEAWRADHGPELGAPWKQGVMDAVRTQAERTRAAATVRTVRRALVASAAAAGLAIVFFGLDVAALDPSLELARVLASDPQALLQWMLVM